MRPIVKVEGGIGRIILIGQFDFNLHREFRQAGQELLDNNAVKIIRIDMEQVPQIDSSALGMLLLLRERAAMNRMTMEIVNCQPAVKQVFEIANMSTHFNFQFA
ncbi:STAS domain-containing protein [Chromobacterium subtsugae]|uniref:STAS domain-containing protein n=1 Tax=Chromobacterium subtsugae TaxID=251747 RepID=A0ABS7FCA2_9NEIS|nr:MULTISPECIES: STAS domain-containing protein [Chromobacterium]KUM02838.1 anti-anti-sigma factor [Chromobacterium subtsugae]KZE87053.1 anti-anti-sigma factor [Chromobacterium sp. F49]MBW7566012.1 STAS domain-containing protein [Chromobacterium subtsugae]MBW8286948.1 STAS domain-containing protein [Chromobacterium subtsugae]OBU88270.1 anti-sigma-factor antagonist [Chromobacterium subtsugae]